MKKATLLYALLTFCVLSCLIAQPPCAFDSKHKKLLETDPSYAQTIEANERSIQRYIANHPELINSPRTKEQNRQMATVYIPVVVHVMHTGGAVGTIYNPTDVQIQGAINYLNQVFAGTFPGMTDPSGGIAAGDLEVQFALAQRTPACGATNGIDRVDASTIPNYTLNGVNVFNTNGVDDITIKNFARWNPANYYNIWIVNKLDGADGTSGQFVAGYAQFAGGPSNTDGTVMLATQMVTGEKTLPHEIGHALNLYHPFQGSSGYDNPPGPVVGDCPVNSDCNLQGDRVCDTDPIYNNRNETSGSYSFACRTGGSNICNGGVPYSINTENNFMSYTNCYTLFTVGQKARITAALALPDRESLVAPGNLALTPCGTTINFSLASSSRTEDISGTLTGCRRYTDYTYQMSIGAAPSATATATLTYSGTGIRGIDYDVTTNGNFASPSSVLTFNTGSTTPQAFTVRVYDDADVESGETAILDFTVNNGGGNATKGVITPTFTLTISDNDLAPVATSSGTFAIGVSAGQAAFPPFDARLQSQRSQYIYRASELTAAGVSAGNLVSLQFFVATKTSSRPFTNLSIKMAHSTASYLYDNGSVSLLSGMTTVFSSASISTIAGWNTFTFSTPFAWNGTSNLGIEVCYDNITADAANGADNLLLYFDGGTANQGSAVNQNGINCAGAFSSFTFYGNGLKPIIQLSNSITGTSVETVATSNKNQHMDAGSSDYFYSNNNRLLMRMTGINEQLGCVNSVLEGAGTTWSSYFGGQRSAKVFAVTPTTNGATAAYSISLYFENAELAGKTAATLRIAKTSAASVAASNASNTTLVTPTVTTLGSGVTIFTATFTGFSRFFLVDPGVTLPVNLTEFSGKPTDDRNTLLNWITGSEQSNKQFDVEISNNGVNFSLLGSVPSQGNSSTEQHYEYLHVKPQSGTSWYRLKQVDIDGKSKYSQTVAVTINNDLVKAFVYPVPSNNTITVNFGSLVNKGNIDILSADMKLVKRETVNNLSLKKDINIQGLSKGVYFIKLSMETGTQLLRFVKE
jgi:hypothetical protein